VERQALVAACASADAGRLPCRPDGVEDRLTRAQQRVEIRAHRNRVRHALGASRGDRACVVTAAAVADDSHAPAVALPGSCDDGVDAVEGAIGAVGVRHEAAGVRAVADTPEPGREHGKRRVARPEPRCQNDRATVAARDAVAHEHGIHEQPRSLEPGAGLRDWPAPPARLRPAHEART
jgi:hypothetical protein